MHECQVAQYNITTMLPFVWTLKQNAKYRHWDSDSNN